MTRGFLSVIKKAHLLTDSFDEISSSNIHIELNQRSPSIKSNGAINRKRKVLKALICQILIHNSFLPMLFISIFFTL